MTFLKELKNTDKYKRLMVFVFIGFSYFAN